MKWYKKKWLIGLIVLAVVVIIVLFNVIVMALRGISMSMPVSVATVSSGDLVQQLDFSGTVMTEETKVYFAPVSGEIATIEVTPGDPVKSGDILMTYDLEALEEISRESELQAKAEGYGIDATIQTIQKSQSDYAQAAKNYDEAMQYVNHYSACLESASRDYNQAMTVKTEYETLKATVDQYKIQQAENETPNPELANLIAQGEARMNELSGQMAQYDYAALEGAVATCSNELNEYKALAQQYKAEKIENPSLASQSAQQSVLRELNNLSKEKADDDLETARAGIRADFNGVITQVDAVEGQTVASGMQLFMLQNTDELKVSVNVSKYDLAQIKVGQKAEITINGAVYRGSVTKINGMAQANAQGAATVTADIHIDNPDENIYLGIEAKVKIQSDAVENALIVPVECVNYDTKGAFCYVVDNGVLLRKDVEAGISTDTQIQIIMGLKAGEQVVTQVTGELSEGMEVTPMPEE